MPDEPITLIGQFISARTLAIGGLRVSFDIPEQRLTDCALASSLALQRQWAQLTVENYEEAQTDRQKAQRKPGRPTS